MSRDPIGTPTFNPNVAPFGDGENANSGSPNAGTSTGNAWIDGIGGESWLDVGENNVISYTLANDFGFGWSTAETNAYERAADAFEAVANLTFVEFTSGTSDMRENIVDTPTMIAETGGNWGGYHLFPHSNRDRNGYYNTDRSYWDTAGLNDGGFGYELMMHEILHGIGLAHPHDTGMSSGIFPGVSNSGDTGDNAQNQTLWTIMSYNSFTYSSDNYGHSRTPMAYDIAALQVHYGANTSNNTGNDTYVIPDSNTNGNAFYESIWDTAGDDTMEYNGTRDVVIDLRSARLDGSVNGGGYLSSPVGIDGGYTISGDFTNALTNVNADFGVIIENAQGGSGDDTINGNSVSNDLIGGGGDDSITALNGNDDISGGTGDDSVNGGLGNDTIEGGAGADSLEGAGGDDIFDYRLGVVSTSQGAGERLDGGSGHDIVRVIGSGAGSTVFDFTSWNVQNMEEIQFQASGGSDISIVFSQKEFDQAGEFASDLHIDGFNGVGMTERIIFNLNSGYLALDMSQWTFQDWGAQGEVIEVNGSSSADTVTGSSQIDEMAPGAGNDSIDLGGEADLLTDLMEDGDSTFEGGAGNDTLDFTGVTDDLVSDGSTVSNATTGATAEINSFYTLLMGSGNDSVTEGDENFIDLGDGNDTLFANADIGIDTFDGGAGTDLFIERFAISQDYDLEAGTVGGSPILLNFEDLDAAAGNDTITGTMAHGNVLDGGAGDDVIDGLDGNDLINGGADNDSLRGQNDDDTVIGGAGDDTLRGNAGNDELSGGFGLDLLDGGGGNDTLSGNDDGDVINGGSGDDVIDGGLGNDVANGGGDNDEIAGSAGNDTLSGDAGDDTLDGNAGQDELNGGSGNDLLRGGGEDDLVEGGDGNDELIGASGNDILRGDDDDDTLDGGSGDDAVSGGLHEDILLGGSGNDILRGQNGFDTMEGGDGNDTLLGGRGGDMMDGGADNDLMDGAAFNDVLNGGTGDDTLSGGGGNDLLRGQDGFDSLVGGANNDTMIGGAGNDTLIGQSGNDELRGNGTDDYMDGGDGDDTLEGGTGRDTLIGGDGDDVLNPNSGLDLLIFNNGDGDDTVNGFSDANQEDIDLSGVTAITDFNDLVNNHLLNFGGDALIVYGPNSILLSGVAFSDVGVGQAYDADDFIF